MNATLSVYQASLLNAEGVHALTTGNAGMAYQKIKQALEIMSQAVHLPLPDAINTKARKNIISSCPVPGFDRSDYYVCNNALLFTVPPSERPQEDLDTTAVATCCFACLFNLALALHQRGLATGTQKHLAAAGRLYEQCLLLRTDLNGQEVNVFATATLNNVAQIYYTLGEFDLALQRLKTTKETMSEVEPIQVESDIGSILQWDDVMLNILVTSKPFGAPCA